MIESGEGIPLVTRPSFVPILRIFLALILLILLAFAGELIYSYECLTVTQETLVTRKVTTPIRAVVLSDLHDHQFGRGNERLVQQVAAQDPDVILLVGDMLNRGSKDTSRVTACVSKLAQIAPVYYALGNHEMDYVARTGEDLREILAQAGATVLDQDYVDVEIAGQKVRIGGMYAYAFARDGYNSTKRENMDADVYRFLTDFQNTKRLTLMLAHRPDSFIFGKAASTWQADLVISGHLHGGQVVLPVLGGVWGGDQHFFPTYVHGQYRKENLNLLITSGLGSDLQKVPRLNNPPEIVVLTLAPDPDWIPTKLRAWRTKQEGEP